MLQGAQKTSRLKSGLQSSSLLCLGLLFLAQSALALPTGWQIENGSATFENPDAQTLNISTTDQAIINFNSFNIGENEKVNFIMPSSTASLLSRVTGSGPSIIAGALNANGNLMLLNTNGVQFASTSQVAANNLVVSTLGLITEDFLNKNYVFVHKNTDPYSQILNQGHIQANNVALISNAISNEGSIIATLGSVELASGNKATMTFDAQGLIAVEVSEKTLQAATGVDGKKVKEAIANSGTIQAARVVINAKVAEDIFESAVNLEGVIQANGVMEQDGVIKIISEGDDIKANATVLVDEHGTIEIKTDKNIQIQGNYEAPKGTVNFEAKGDIQVVGPTITKGDTTLKADRNLEVHANITTDSGNLNLVADANKDGQGQFKQDAGTTIKTANFGDIHISSSGEAKLGNIEASGEVYLETSVSEQPVVFTNVGASFMMPNNSGMMNHAPTGVNQWLITGSLHIEKGVTLNAGDTNINVFGSWLNHGTFNGQGSTVDFKGTNEAQITGTNNFNHLKILVPGKVVDFQGGETQNILGILQLNGGWGQPITLRSTSPPVPWKIFAHSSTDIQYVDVSNADNINILGPPIVLLHSRNSLGNTGWDFSLAGPSWQPDSQFNNNFWSNPHNWDSGLIPGAGDIVKMVTGTIFTDAVIDPLFSGTIAGLTLESGFNGTVTLARDLNVTGNVVLNGGTLKMVTVTNYLTVGGNWTAAGGVFDPGASTVIFNDASQLSRITGNNTFYNLTINTPNKKTYFQTGKAQTVLNEFYVEGQAGKLIWLRSTSSENLGSQPLLNSPGTQWFLDLKRPDLAVVRMVHLGDAHNLSSQPIKALPSNSFGNNTGWDTDPVWDNTSGDGLWSTDTNWDTDVQPGAGDTVTFNATSTANSTVDAGFAGTIDTLIIDSSYSGTITLQRSLTVNAGLTSSGGTLDMGTNNISAGAVTLSGGTISSSTGILTGTSYEVESGTISAILAGTGILTKSTVGTVTLSGANIYSGGTNLVSGTVNINHATALGSGLITFNGATIDNTSGASITLSNNNPQSWGDSFAFTGSNALNLGTGAVALVVSMQVSVSASTLTVGGVISGAFNLEKSGNGTLTLSGVNTYTGLTTVNAGTLLYGVNNALSSGNVTVSGGTLDLATFTDTVGTVILSSGTITSSTGILTSNAIYDVRSGTISGILAGSVGLTKTTAGTVTISSANTYTGATTVSAGVLNIQNATATGTTAGGISVTAGAALQIQGAITVAEALTLNGTGVSADGALRSISGNNSWTGAITLGSTGVRINSDANTITLSNAAGITGAGFSLTVGGSGNIIISTGGIFTSTAGTLTKDGSGTLTISAVGSYTGGTTISAGILNLQNSSGLGSSGSVVVSSGAVLELQSASPGNTITLNGSGIANGGALRNISGTNTVGGSIVLGSDTRINSDSGTLQFSGSGGITGTGFALTVGGSGNISISGGGINTSTNGSLIKDGTGTLTISGSGNYTGVTTISSGVIALSNTTGLGTTAGATTIASGSALNLSSGVTSAEPITVNGTGISNAGAIRNSGSNNTLTGAIVLGSATRINSDSGTLTLAGGITGDGMVLTVGGAGAVTISTNGINTSTNGTLTVDMSGTSSFLSISAASNYTGATLISSGVVTISNALALGTTAGGTTVSSGAALKLSGTIDIIGETLSLSGSGNSTGALNNISGSNSWTGAITLSAGTTISSDAGILTLSGGISGTATDLTLGSGASGAGGNIVVNSVIGITSGSLSKYGSGTTTLSGANTYTGLTTIGAGVLNIQHATALGTTASGTSVSSGAALQLQGNIAVGAEAITSISGTGVSTTGAIRNISGDNSFAGTIAFGGTTRFNSDAGTLTFSGVLSSSGSAYTFGGSGNITINSVVGSGSSSLTKDGSGTLTLSAANTYTGSTTVSAGVLNVQHATALGTTAGATSVTSGAALQIQGGITVVEAITLNGTGISSDGVLRNISGNNSWTGAIILGSTGVRINSDANAISLSNAAGITGTGFALTVGGSGNTTITLGGVNTSTAGTLTKDGSGTLTISVNGDYTGATTINAGVVSVSTVTALGTSAGATTVAGTGAALETTGTAASAEPLTLNGTGIASGGAFRKVSGNQTWSGAITLASDSSIGVVANTLTLSGGISGAFALTKVGAGTLTAGAAFTPGGAFTISAGTYNANGNTTTVTGLTTVSGGTYTAATATQTFNSGLTISGGTFTGSTGAVDVNGDLTFSSGTLTAPSGSFTVSGSWTTSSPGTTFTPGTNTITFDGTGTQNLDVAGGNYFYALTHSGSGTLRLMNGLMSAQGGFTNSNGIFDMNGYNFSAYGFLMSGGTFTPGAGTPTLSIDGDFSLTAGTFTAPDSIAMAGNWSKTGGTFNHNNGTVSLNAVGAEITIVSGGGHFYNLGLDNSSGPGGFLLEDALYVENDLTASTSTYLDVKTAENNSITVGGSAYFSGIFYARAGTITLNGSGTQLFDSGGNSFYTIVHSGSGTLQLSTNALDVDFQFTNSAGTFDLNGQNWTMIGATFSNDGIIQLIGSETITGLTQDTNSGTFKYVGNGDSAGDTYTIKDFGGTDYYNLTIAGIDSADIFQSGGVKAVAGGLSVSGGSYDANGNTTTVTGLTTVSGGTYTASTATQTFNGGLTVSGGTFTGSSGTVDVNGNLTLSGGTFTAPTSMTLSGNFDRSGGGTFTHNSGTVTLDGTNQTIAGSSTFNNLSKTVAAADTLTFTAGTTQTIAGALILQGASGQLLSLRSSSTPSVWTIDPQGSRTVSYVDVKDSTNSNGTAITAATSHNSLNNTNWLFSATTLTWTGATSTDWNTASNWDLGYVPNSSDNVVIAASARAAILDSSRTINNLTVQGANTLSLGDHTLTAAAVTLTSGTISKATTGTLSGTSFSAASGTISAILADNAGAAALTKTTAGTVTLSGANTFTGATIISAGVLNIQHATALGTTAGGVSVTSGAALQLQGGITVGAEALTLNGTGVSSDGALRNISGNNTFGGAITLGSATQITSDANTLTLTGGITGAGNSLLIGGSGNITATTNNISVEYFYKEGSGTFTQNVDLSIVNDFLQSAGAFVSDTTKVFSAGASFSIPTTAGAFFRFTGTGSSGDPYLIYDVYGLQAMTYDLSKAYKLNGNIDATVTTNWNGGDGFVTVGDNSSPFTGTLNGNSKIVDNLFIGAGLNYTGLIGKISGASSSITSIGLTDVNITGGDYVGGLVGFNSLGTISNSYVTGAVTGNDYVGGLTGYSNGAISTAYTNSTVNGNGYVGGLVGHHSGGSIANSYTAGSTTGTGARVGGLIGLNELGLVSNSYTKGAVSANDYAGGLIGYSENGEITNSYSVSSGSVAPGNAYGGVLGGYFSSNSISNLAYWTGAGGGFGEYNGDPFYSIATAGKGTESSSLSAFYNPAHPVYKLGSAGSWDMTTPVWDSYYDELPRLHYEGHSGNYNSIWSGTTSTNWATASNWINNATPVASSHVVIFTGSNNPTLSAGTPTVSTLTTISGTLTQNNTLTVTNALTLIEGTITGSGTTTAGSYDLRSGTISGILGGSGAVTKTTTGTVTLSGANTYTGATTISAGVLNLQHATAAGTTAGGFSVASGAALQLQGGIAVGAEALAIQGTGIASDGVVRNILGSNSWSGNISMSGDAYIVSDSGTLTLSGSISGTFGVKYLTVGGAGNITASGIIGTNLGVLTKNSAGMLTLSGANTFSGLTLNAGTLNINNAQALGTPGGTFTINGGTIDNTSGSSLTTIGYSQTWAGDFTFTGSNALNLGTGGVSLSADRTVTVSASTLTVGGSVSGNTFGITKAGVGALTLNGDIGTTTGIVTVNAGTLTLAGANTYSGTTTLASGATLNINSATALGSGAFIISGGTIDNTSGGSITLSNNNVQNWNGDFTFTGSNDLDLGTGNVTLGSSRQLTISASNLTVAGAISGANALRKDGNGTLTLSGNSTYSGGTFLSTGPLNINSATALGTGYFQIGATFDNTSGSPITLSNNNTIRISSSFTFTGSNALNLGTGAVTLFTSPTITVSASTLTIGGDVSGAGLGITKDGNGILVLNGAVGTTTGTMTINAGTLTLAGANTYSGTTTLASGATLNINHAAALGSGTFTISGGTIDNTLGSSITLTNNNVQNWNGDFTFTGSNALNLGTGAVTMSASRQITTTTSTLTVGGSISGNTFGITKAGAGELKLDGVIGTTTGTVTVSAGTLTLTGANTYTGAVIVSAGVLNIRNATATGTTAGGVSVTSGAALQIQGTIAVGNEILTLNGSGVSSDGALRNISGTNGWSGAITLGSATRINSDANTLTLSGGITGAGNALTVGGAGNVTLSTTASTVNAFTKDGAGTFTQSAGLTVTNNFTQSAGVIVSDPSAALTIGGSFAIPATAGSFSRFTGAGLVGDPYLIYDVYGLQAMSYDLAAYYKLNNNIDAAFTNTHSWNSGSGFVPIGTSGSPFTGVLDGNSKTIDSLYINRPATNNIGLIGYKNGASSDITNIGLTNANVTGNIWVGALVGVNNANTISNSYVTGSVVGKFIAGVQVGSNAGTISNSYATGNITGSGTGSFIGGLVGYNTGTINDSYATGTVDATAGSAGDNVGGFVGQNTGTINRSYATGQVDSFGDNIGGLVGYAFSGSINNSYATGQVFGGSAVGGLVGEHAGTISNSYATGNILGGEYLGGLTGDNAGSITNSYATGSTNFTGLGTLRGGLTGNNPGSITNSYFTGTNNSLGTYESAGASAFYNPAHAVYNIGDASEWDFFTPIWDTYTDKLPHLHYEGITSNINSVWSGNTSIAWATASNWSDNAIPGVNSRVVIFDRTNDPTLSVGGSTISSLTMNSGTFTQNASLTITNALTLVGGTITGSGTATAGSYDLKNGTMDVVLAGSGDLTKTTIGTVTLSKSNTYTGTTIINEGILAVTANSALGTTAGDTQIIFGATLDFQNVNYTTTEVLNIDNATLTSSTGTSSLAGNIYMVNGDVFIGVDGTSLSLTGIISSDPGIGIIKYGTGVLILSGANTYSGLTTVSAGVLNIQHATALGTTANGISITSGAALQLQGGITVGNEALTLNGTGISSDGALINILGINSWSGAITLGSATRINSDAGTLTLSGNIVGAAKNLIIGGSGNTTLSGIIGTTSGTLTKDGSGTLILSGANTYTGLTTVSAGILNIQHATALGTTAAGTSITAGAALQLQGGITVGNESLTLNGAGITSDGALRNVSGTNTWGGVLTLGSDSTIASDAGGLTIASIAGASKDLTLTGNTGTTTVSGNVSALGDGTGAALTVNNTLTGLVTFQGTFGGNSGISAGAATSLRFNNDITLANGDTATSMTGAVQFDGLTWSGFDGLTIGALTLSSGDVHLNSNAGNIAITTIAGGSKNLFLDAGIGVGTTIVSGAVSVLGDGTGAILTVDNAVTGLVTFQGTLAGNSGISAGAATSLRFNDDVTLADGSTATSMTGAVQFDGLTWFGYDGLTIGTLTLSGAAVNFNSNNGNITFNSTIEGTQNLSLTSGAGAITLSGALGSSTRLGNLTINSGTATFAANVKVASFSNAGTVNAGATTWNVSGNWTNTGTFNANTSTVNLDGTSQTIIGSTTFNNLSKVVTTADTLTFTAGTTQSISGALTLQGASGQLLSLVSSVPTTVWNINPQGTRTINYVSVQDSTNTNGTTIAATNSISAGNNTNWSFDAATLRVTGTASMTAGGTNELTITAYDAYGNVATGYTGAKSLTISGLSNATTGEVPSVEGTNLGTATSINFTNGVSDSNVATLTAYKSETASVDVTDGTINSTGNAAYDLDLTVNPAAASSLNLSAASSIINAGAPNQLTITAYDVYGNVATGYNGSKNFTFSGANSSGLNNPTVTNSSSVAIDFGSLTAITFTNGVSTSGGLMSLYKIENASVSGSDGSLTSNTVSVTVNLATINSGSTTWVGSVSSDWNNALNWDLGVVPDLSTNVIIATTLTQPILTGSTQVGSVTINSGNTLTTNGNSLMVNGQLSVAGTLAIASSTVTVSGNLTSNGGTITGNTPTLIVQGSIGTLNQPVVMSTTSVNVQARGGDTPLSISARGASESFQFNEPIGGFVFLSGYLQKEIGQQNIRALLNQVDSQMFAPMPAPVFSLGGGRASPMMLASPTLIGIAPRMASPVGAGSAVSVPARMSVPVGKMPFHSARRIEENQKQEENVKTNTGTGTVKILSTETVQEPNLKKGTTHLQATQTLKEARAAVVFNTVRTIQDFANTTSKEYLSSQDAPDIFVGSKAESYFTAELFQGAKAAAIFGDMNKP